MNPTQLQQDGLKEIFDQQKVLERLEMGQVAGQVGFQAAGDLAWKMGWDEGSPERALLHGAVAAGMAALGGGNVLDGLTGAVANQMAFNAMRDYLTETVELEEGSPAFNLLLQLGSTAVGAAVGSGTGAATALSATQNNYLTHQQMEAFEEKLSQCQDQSCRDMVRQEAAQLSAAQDAALRVACADSNSGACVGHLVLAQEYGKATGRDQAMDLGLQQDWARSFLETSQFLNRTGEGYDLRTTFSDEILGPWARHLDEGDLLRGEAVREYWSNFFGEPYEKDFKDYANSAIYGLGSAIFELSPFGDVKGFMEANSVSDYVVASIFLIPGAEFIKLGKKVEGALPGGWTVEQFESGLSRLPPGERVATVKMAAASVANAAGMVKDAKLSRINGRDVYRSQDGSIYALDTQHGRFEVINPRNGKHLGEVDFGFRLKKPADSSGGHNLKVD